jgi:ketol-acid reductoisomerase
MQPYYDADIDEDIIRDKKIAIMGFGAQGRAHAQNLSDSGLNVVVGLRPESSSREHCSRLGLEVAEPGTAAEAADIVVMLTPDETQAALYEQFIAPRLRAGAALVFAHGYNVHFGHVRPRADLDVIMVAPLGIGEQVRRTYSAGGGVPALLAVAQDASGRADETGLAYAKGNGHGRAGVIRTTFREEVETDLFAEQSVLCGGLTHLILAAFETLVDAGYSEELAYFGCLHEVKLIADLVHTRGIAGMRRSISSTAEYGDYTRGPRIINERSREEMRRILEEIRSGDFDRELTDQASRGFPAIRRGRQEAESHPIESVGGRLRSMMPWLSEE